MTFKVTHWTEELMLAHLLLTLFFMFLNSNYIQLSFIPWLFTQFWPKCMCLRSRNGKMAWQAQKTCHQIPYIRLVTWVLRLLTSLHCQTSRFANNNSHSNWIHCIIVILSSSFNYDIFLNLKILWRQVFYNNCKVHNIVLGHFIIATNLK